MIGLSDKKAQTPEDKEPDAVLAGEAVASFPLPAGIENLEAKTGHVITLNFSEDGQDTNNYAVCRQLPVLRGVPTANPVVEEEEVPLPEEVLQFQFSGSYP